MAPRYPTRKSGQQKRYNTRRRYFGSEVLSQPVIHNIHESDLTDFASEDSDDDLADECEDYSHHLPEVKTKQSVRQVQFLSSEFDAPIPESGDDGTVEEEEEDGFKAVIEKTQHFSADKDTEVEVNALQESHKRKGGSDESEFDDPVALPDEESVSELTDISDDQRPRFTRQRSKQRHFSQRLKKRKLREKESIDYSKQLMPDNFTQVLDREFKDLQYTTKKKEKKYNKRLNESDDESQPIVFKNRTLALLSKAQHNKNTIIPQNMDDMLRAEEQRLLHHVSAEVKEQFVKHRPDFKEHIQVGFDMVAGFEDHIMALKEMVGLPLMYPELFSEFGIQPPKGVLFHGPPGLNC
jgi:SpoVK/Ycf46/Vps4 family AAA+-type ATPase